MGLPFGKARLARWGPGVLHCLALLSLVIALAGPRWPDLHTRIETEGIAIVMLVYLTTSLTTSVLMNWYNARVAIHER